MAFHRFVGYVSVWVGTGTDYHNETLRMSCPFNTCKITELLDCRSCPHVIKERVS
jgi:hypothetical protein